MRVTSLRTTALARLCTPTLVCLFLCTGCPPADPGDPCSDAGNDEIGGEDVVCPACPVISPTPAREPEQPCGDSEIAAQLGIELPTPPSPYALPLSDAELAICKGGPDVPGVHCVSTTAELAQVVLSTEQEDIILADGDYFDEGELLNGYLQIAGHRLWAENLGDAVLHFGVSAGGGAAKHYGPQFHGLHFDISDQSAVPLQGGQLEGSTALLGFGQGEEMVVADCSFEGHGIIHQAISTAATRLLRVERVEIHDFLRYGLFVDRSAGSNPRPLLAKEAVTVADVSISNIDDPLWEAENPETNFRMVGMWFGDRVNASRIRLRDIRFAGITTVHNAGMSTFSHLDIDRIGTDHSTGSVGVYFDNISRSVEVETFCIGNDVRFGVNSEQDHVKVVVDGVPTNESGFPMFPRGIDNIVSDGVVAAYCGGVQFDRGTVNGTIHDITFRGYTQAGIILFDNVSSEELWPLYDNGTTQFDNLFEGGGRCDFTRSHWNSLEPVCIDP